MYEPITVEVDRAYGDGAHRPNPITFTGRLLGIVEGGQNHREAPEVPERGNQ